MSLSPGVQKWFQPVRLFRSQASVFAGMGIEACHDQMWRWPEALAKRKQHRQFVFHNRRIQGLRHLIQWQMRGRQQGVEPPAGVG